MHLINPSFPPHPHPPSNLFFFTLSCPHWSLQVFRVLSSSSVLCYFLPQAVAPVCPILFLPLLYHAIVIFPGVFPLISSQSVLYFLSPLLPGPAWPSVLVPCALITGVLSEHHCALCLLGSTFGVAHLFVCNDGGSCCQPSVCVSIYIHGPGVYTPWYAFCLLGCTFGIAHLFVCCVGGSYCQPSVCGPGVHPPPGVCCAQPV